MKKKILMNSLVFFIIIALGIHTGMELNSYRTELRLKQELIQGEYPETHALSLEFETALYVDRHTWITEAGISEKPFTRTNYYPNGFIAENYDTKIFPYLLFSNHHFERRKKDQKEENEKVSRLDYFVEIREFDFYEKILSEMIENKEKYRTLKLSDYMDYIPLYISSTPEIEDAKFREDSFLKENSLGKALGLTVKDDLRVKIDLEYLGEDEHFVNVLASPEVLPPYQDPLFYSLCAWDKPQKKLLFSLGISFVSLCEYQEWSYPRL